VQQRSYQARSRLPVWNCIFMLMLISVSTSSAQLKRQFGQELFEQEVEEPSAFESELTVDYQISNTFNNHLEFGLSIDPNTSSLAGRENTQLQGVVNQAGVNFQGTLPLGNHFGLKFQYYPQFENYIGESGQLNEFDAFTDLFLTELNFRPTAQLPLLSLSHQLQRLDRKDDAYDDQQRQLSFRFGKLLEYNLRIRQFDDDLTRREDFLLVGATSHQGVARIQIGFLKRVLGKFEYSIEGENYRNNLNNLVQFIAGLQGNESRTDLRQFLSAKLVEIPTAQLVFQEEFNLFLNNSDVGFYDYSSVEVAMSAFYKIDSHTWARLRLSHLGIYFDERKVRGAGLLTDENGEKRKDNQTGLNLRLNWQLHDHLTLLADYQLTKNSTNETAEIFDFLNYLNNIASFTIQATY
jgi:hypothetical protein